ncbi:hypothetical protein N0V95_009133, partial [Ascochyta clinopodiicola]
MATEYYLAAHGGHFPMVHTEPAKPARPAHPDPVLSVQHQTPPVPSAAAASKLTRADSVTSRTAGPMNAQETSLFFRLPAELRNQIYEALLCASTPTNLATLALTPRLPVPGRVHPAILATCKRINTEATALLYSTP